MRHVALVFPLIEGGAGSLLDLCIQCVVVPNVFHANGFVLATIGYADFSLKIGVANAVLVFSQ